MELDLEVMLMGETLVINRSLDPFLEDYIKLNHLNEPIELRRNQGDDLMLTVEEGKVIEEFRTRDEDLDTGIDDYLSYCGDDKKIYSRLVFIQLINTAYPLPLDTAYRSFGIETKVLVFLFDFRAKNFLSFFGANPTDCLFLVTEEAKAMAETMEQYMSKTRTDYGSGVARPKIEEKDSFELKGQFLKELRENAFSGSNNEDMNEHIEKVLEIVDLFHEDLKTKFLNNYCPSSQTTKKMEEINKFQQEPDETLYLAWEHFKKILMKCPQHYLTEMQEVILFYNGLDVPTRQILDSRGVVPHKIVGDAKKAIQEMAKFSQKWHNGTSRGRSTKTSNGLAAIQAQLNNLGREIKKVNEKVYVAQVGCEQCKGLHYTKDFPLKEE
uniref:Retrotransposon gag domain-containing protein n=1 Tax=Tanacetum cinerariifolium TaxID=118510 RepID=A0A699J3A7_TANCI|nr:hypothetical protein [Tanacetum cinerariifolium]